LFNPKGHCRRFAFALVHLCPSRIHFPATLGSCGFPIPHFSDCLVLGLGSRGAPRSLQTLVCPHRFRCSLAISAPAAHRYYDGSDCCSPSPRATALPAYLTHTSQRCASNHMGGPHVVLSTKTTHAMCFRLRLLPASSPPHPAESSSLYCAPPVRLRLLPTPPRSDAVTLDYGALAYPDTDSHHAVYAPSRAH
jgi:hypothetical protein